MLSVVKQLTTLSLPQPSEDTPLGVAFLDCSRQLLLFLRSDTTIVGHNNRPCYFLTYLLYLTYEYR